MSLDDETKTKLIAAGIDGLFSIGSAVVKAVVGVYRSPEEIAQALRSSSDNMNAEVERMTRRGNSAHDKAQAAIDAEERRQREDTDPGKRAAITTLVDPDDL